MISKRKLMITLSTVFVSAICLGFSFGAKEVNNAYAAEAIQPVYFNTQTKGASVKADTTSVGIRYETVLTKEDYNKIPGSHATLSLITQIKPYGTNKNPRVYEWKLNDEMFEDGKEVFHADLIYNNLTEEQRQQAVAVELEVESKIKDKTTMKNVAFFNANDNVRSMRAVAAAAIENGYAQQDLLKGYVGNKVEDVSKSTFNLEVDSPAQKLDDVFNVAYFGAKKVSRDSVDGNTVGGAKIEDIEYGTNSKLFLFDNSNNYKVYSSTYATKVFRTKEDLLYLNTTPKTYDGYYVLANDIDATGLEKISDRTVMRVFTGTFDGQGHTIDNVTVDKDGLFGAIKNKAVLKNFALTNVKFPEGESYAYSQLFGEDMNSNYKGEPITVTDVYIHIRKIPVDTNWGPRAVVFGNTMRFVNMKNVVVSLEEGQEFINKDCPSKKTMLLERNGIIGRQDEGNTFENMYCITPKYLGAVYTGKEVRVYYGENETLEKPEDLKALYSEGVEYGKDSNGNVKECVVSNIKGIKKYNNKYAMMAANNDLTAFNEKYWDTSTGIPVWKTSGYIETKREPIIKVDGKAANEISLENGKTCQLEVSIEGFTSNEISLEVKDTGIVTIDKNQVTGTAVGNTVINVKVYGNIVAEIPVNITNKVIVNTNKYDLDQSTGKFTTEQKQDMFGDGNAVILSAQDKSGKYQINVENDTLKIMDGTQEIVANGNAIELLITTSNGVYDTFITPCTKVITKGEDLSYFYLNGNRDDLRNGKKFSGYYILGNDIDATPFKSQLAMNGCGLFEDDHDKYGNNYKDFGLTGTFDGRGHVIDNYSMGRDGIFSLVSGTIKNVKVVVTTSHAVNTNSIFSYVAYSTAVFENICIEGRRVNNKPVIFGSGSAILTIAVNNEATRGTGATTFKNIFIDTSNISLDGRYQSYLYEVQLMEINKWSHQVNTSNVVIVSKDGVIHRNKPEAGNSYANQYIYVDGENKPAEGVITLKGVTRYANRDELKNAKADLTAFDETYWDITTGIPVWKTAK